MGIYEIPYLDEAMPMNMLALDWLIAVLLQDMPIAVVFHDIENLRLIAMQPGLRIAAVPRNTTLPSPDQITNWQAIPGNTPEEVRRALIAMIVSADENMRFVAWYGTDD